MGGRPATTHWFSVAELAAHPSGGQVRADERFIDNGDTVTAAGVSAGIDVALQVRRLHDEDMARQVYVQSEQTRTLSARRSMHSLGCAVPPAMASAERSAFLRNV